MALPARKYMISALSVMCGTSTLYPGLWLRVSSDIGGTLTKTCDQQNYPFLTCLRDAQIVGPYVLLWKLLRTIVPGPLVPVYC